MAPNAERYQEFCLLLFWSFTELFGRDEKFDEHLRKAKRCIQRQAAEMSEMDLIRIPRRTKQIRELFLSDTIDELRTNIDAEADEPQSRSVGGVPASTASQQLQHTGEITPTTHFRHVCLEPGCDTRYQRSGDLLQHERTEHRPWKCPVPTCKYHDYGWPTEKEMGRHINDKHAAKPATYECTFPQCPYESKRESNCKQHMEKIHGWTYVYTKNNNQREPVIQPSNEKGHQQYDVSPRSNPVSPVYLADQLPRLPPLDEVQRK